MKKLLGYTVALEMREFGNYPSARAPWLCSEIFTSRKDAETVLQAELLKEWPSPDDAKLKRIVCTVYEED